MSTLGVSTETVATTGAGTSSSATPATPPMVFTQAQFIMLMSAVSTTTDLQANLDEKLLALREELKKEQEINTQHVAKRAKLEKPQIFKSKGNEEQHRFLEKAVNQLDDAQVELEKAVAQFPATSTSSSSASEPLATLNKAMEFLKSTKSTLQQRQKLIRMADGSELGWLVVNEYEEDELADDEEDAKRMANAQKSAEEKFEAVLAKKRNSMGSSMARQTFSGVAGSGVRQAFYRAGAGSIPPRVHQQNSGRPQTMLGHGFACHEYGHLRSSCPKFGASQGSVYPFRSDETEINDVGYDNGIHDIEWDDGHGGCVSLNTYPIGDDEYLEGLNERVCVKGRLRERYDYWSNVLHAPEPILRVIREGYFLPLMHEPPQFYRANNRSVNDHEVCVTDSITELVSQQCVKRVASRPHVCSPLLVVVNGNSGKKRLVISLKYLNLFLWKDKFKYEDIRTAMEYFEREGYMCTFDLKSGYHHVDVCELSQKYLGFE